MLDADAAINNSSQKVGGSNAYPDPAPKKVGGSGPRKTHMIYAPAAIADGPRDATCQSNSCQLLHNSVGTTCTTSPEKIEVMELEGYSRPTYNKLVHSATTHSTVVGVIHKLTVDEFVDNTCTPTICCGEIF